MGDDLASTASGGEPQETDWVILDGHFIRASAVERFYADSRGAHITLSSGTYTYGLDGDTDEMERLLRLAFCGPACIPPREE